MRSCFPPPLAFSWHRISRLPPVSQSELYAAMKSAALPFLSGLLVFLLSDKPLDAFAALPLVIVGSRLKKKSRRFELCSDLRIAQFLPTALLDLLESFVRLALTLLNKEDCTGPRAVAPMKWGGCVVAGRRDFAQQRSRPRLCRHWHS